MTQFGFAGSSNNVNKTAKDISTLLSNCSYKGVGANIDYQPDFSTQGTNRPTTAGMTFQHDFTLEPEKYMLNRLTANYFASNIDTTANFNTKTISAPGDNTIQNLNSISNRKVSDLSQNLFLGYDRRKNNYSLVFGALFNKKDNTTKTFQEDSSANTTLGPQSKNIASNLMHLNFNRLGFNASVIHQKPAGGDDRVPGNWSLDYTGDVTSIKSDTSKVIDFVAFINPSSSTNYNRIYNDSKTIFMQNLDAKLNDFSNFFFDYRGSIAIGLENNATIDHQDFHNDVSDMDTALKSYRPNDYLSVNRSYTVIDERPSINISKKFSQHLSGRYQKDAIIGVSIQTQVYTLKSVSDHLIQNFTQNYNRLTPKANLTFNNIQYGNFSNQIAINYSSTYDYPSLEQLYPIIDNSNAYNVQVGNPYLKPSHKNEFSFSFQHNGLEAKNTFDYSANGAAGFIKDGFAFNIKTDSSGRSTFSYVNLDGFKFASLSSKVKKAYKFDHNQLQFEFVSSLLFSNTPSYIKNFNEKISTINKSNNLASNVNLTAYYTYTNLFAINLTEELDTYDSKQTGLNNNKFENALQRTQLSASLNCTPRWTLGSNISQNNNTSTGSGAIHFTIWNASSTFRFRKDNDIELKFSALDLLHQNTGIINYGNNMSLTHGTVNVLRQYFMVTLSYFPRKFGNNKM